MQKVVVFIAVLVSNLILSQNSEPKKIVDDFFIGFHAKDSIALQKVCHANMVLQTVTNAKENLRLKTEVVSEFYKSIASIPAEVKVLEKIIDYKVQIDGNMAHVWTPYEFYVNDKLSHIGVNSFTMVLEPNGEWKIVHIIDTRRKKITK